jgi:magnesium-transporting ATPase (P-type)
VIEAYATKALRVLLLAYRDFESEQDWDNEDALASHLTLLSFVGILVRGRA